MLAQQHWQPPPGAHFQPHESEKMQLPGIASLLPPWTAPPAHCGPWHRTPSFKPHYGRWGASGQPPMLSAAPVPIFPSNACFGQAEGARAGHFYGHVVAPWPTPFSAPAARGPASPPLSDSNIPINNVPKTPAMHAGVNGPRTATRSFGSASSEESGLSCLLLGVGILEEREKQLQIDPQLPSPSPTAHSESMPASPAEADEDEDPETPQKPSVARSKHKRRGKASASFRCTFCNARFTTRQHLSRHRHIHDPYDKLPNPCPAGCGKRFSRSDHAKIHFRRAHGGELPASPNA